MEPNDKNRFSAAMIREAVVQAWTRFPLAVIWLVVFSVGMMIAFINPAILQSHKGLDHSLVYGGFMGYCATLAVTLWCEFLGKNSRIAVIVAALIIAADSVIIYCQPWATAEAGIVGRIALGTALVVACIFVPAPRRENWHFAWSQFCNVAAAVLIGTVCMGAIMIIFSTIEGLFNIHYGNAIWCFITLGGFSLPAMMILGRTITQSINAGDAAGFRLSVFASGTFLYFLLPLTVIYLAVFYVYGLNILFRWSLPNGFVTLPGTVLCAAVLALMFFLEGVRRSNPSNNAAALALKWLPWLALPVVLLMSIAIIYRVAQYGFTPPRLYVLTFNVWCWVVFILLGLKENRNYGYVARSFALVFAATSILPWANYMNLGKYLERPSSPSEEHETLYRRYSAGNDIPVPEGFRRMHYESVFYKSFEDNIPVIKGVAYPLPADSIMATGEDDFKAFFIRPASGSSDSVYVVTGVEFSKTGKGIVTDNIEGYLYMK